MANLQVYGIIEKMTGKDKDFRYMATSDLLNELNKESFKLDMDLEMKLSSIILKQLDDVAGDVSGLAKVGEEHIAAEGKSKYDGVRGIISDKWSMRILWDCALGSAVGLYMVAVERQTQNRARALA
ncbi:hypothetical protein Bca101_077503 [Brassica carinata]